MKWATLTELTSWLVMEFWQVLLVTGGYYNDDRLDSTELLVPGSGSWRLATGLLPRPIAYMKAATVDNTLYITGRIELWSYYYHGTCLWPVPCTDVCIQVALMVDTVTRSWSSALTPRTGAWLATWWRIEITTLSPPSTLKMSVNGAKYNWIRQYI